MLLLYYLCNKIFIAMCGWNSIKTTGLENYNVCRTVAFLVTAKKWIMAIKSAILDKSQSKMLKQSETMPLNATAVGII